MRSDEQGGRPPALADSPWFHASVFFAAAGLAALVWSTLCTAPGIPWNPPRLAPSFALARGLPIYALRDSGAQLGWCYGPVFPLWYLPVALLDHPTPAHVLAAMINLGTILVPLALLVREAEVVPGRRLMPVMVLVAVLLYGHGVLHDNFYFLHVDAVCLAFSFLGALALHRAARTGAGRWLHLAALALALACWAKQLAVALYPAAFSWLWFEHRRELLWPFTFWCLVYGAAVTAGIFVFFGPAEVLFNVWLARERIPWLGGGPLLLHRGWQLLVATAGWLPLALWAVWAKRTAATVPLPLPAAALTRLLLWFCVWSLPLGILASLKIGGGLNSVHSLVFLFAAAVLWLVRQTNIAGLKGQLGSVTGAWWLLAIILVVASGVHLTVQQRAVWRIHHGQERLLDMARAQPGRYYFPWNPLVTIIADHRVQPLDDALYCLWLAGLEVPPEKVRAAVPPNPIILYEEPAQSHFALRYFSGRKTAP